ncbi:MAG: type II toxin-antitoxin system VapC family toxin [Paludibacteraceae bacterium]|nr:type II toxin-antitoxin system VapC family toxin [Paludibacteraceae bacterium]
MTKKVVIDTSVFAKWLVSEGEKYLDKADEILNDLETGKVTIFAPELSKYELGNVFWKRSLDLSDTENVISTMYSIPITFISDNKDLTTASYKYATRLKITYYDAAFIALAEYLNAVLVSDNLKHQGKVEGIKVIGLKDYSLKKL